jgi:hypothetical protein
MINGTTLVGRCANRTVNLASATSACEAVSQARAIEGHRVKIIKNPMSNFYAFATCTGAFPDDLAMGVFEGSPLDEFITTLCADSSKGTVAVTVVP